MKSYIEQVGLQWTVGILLITIGFIINYPEFTEVNTLGIIDSFLIFSDIASIIFSYAEILF